MIGLLAEIVDWDDIREMEAEMAIVLFATFKTDFFPWRKGDKEAVLSLVHKESETQTWLESSDEDGKVLQSCRVQLVPMHGWERQGG